MSNLDIDFLTHEVGSLRKPNAFIKAGRNQKLTDADFDEFKGFLSLVGETEVSEELKNLFTRVGPETANDKDLHNELAKWRVWYNVKYKESSGIDLIDAGEWIRREMYQHIVDNDVVSGIKMLQHVRSFDYNFYKVGVNTSPIQYDRSKSIHVQEFKWASEVATKPLKVCVTSFNTVAEWSLKGKNNFDDLMFDFIDEVFVPETIKLLDAGVNWIQMDEPALTTHPKHVDTFVDGWNYWVDKISGHLKPDTVLGLHNCFSDYNLLWPILPDMKNLGAITLEFANRDTWKLGTDDESRVAFAEHKQVLKNLYDTGFKAKAALGVLPVHTDHETSPELIRDRLLYIQSFIDDPKLVLAAPDCGLRQRSLEVSHKVLKNMSKGAELAKKELE